MIEVILVLVCALGLGKWTNQGFGTLPALLVCFVSGPIFIGAFAQCRPVILAAVFNVTVLFTQQVLNYRWLVEHGMDANSKYRETLLPLVLLGMICVSLASFSMTGRALRAKLIVLWRSL
jgi:hypothetical protein